MTVRIRKAFPGLKRGSWQVTSPPNDEYNCIAWAAEENGQWWWPDQMGLSHWPESVPREQTVGAFVLAFETLGYGVTDSPAPEEGIEKIALFVDASGTPTHAARQLNAGEWTSKLGAWEDISHDLNGVSGTHYGQPAVILSRPVAV